MLKIIITMAGEGSRFKSIGFTQPKYQLVVKDKTLFEWSLITLKNFFRYPFVFITRKEHHTGKFIEDQCRHLGIKDFSIREIDFLTKGQAATVIEADRFLHEDDSLLIYNIDTYIDPNTLHPEDIIGDGWVPGIEIDGEKWSFVDCDSEGRVSRVTEKERISPYASVGLYYFKSYKLYKEVYAQKDLHKLKEEYIAPLYMGLIRDGLDVRSKILPKGSMHVLGTPEDILLFSPEFQKQIDAVTHK